MERITSYYKINGVWVWQGKSVILAPRRLRRNIEFKTTLGKIVSLRPN